MIEFVVDNRGPVTAFPHFWEKCVGSCHALTGLREDWRRQLVKCYKELGFQAVRCHGLLDDDMSVYKRDRSGSPYSFYNIDNIYDFLLEHGMKPFVELGFMPEGLASGTQTAFHYRGNVTPPRDYKAWGDLIEALVAHLVARYGVEEVRSWYFEVWNEPNLSFFWAGTMKEYFKLYEYAARAVKRVDPLIPVGGPATAKNEWIPELIAYCRETGTPLDFISTHHYPTDAALGHNLNMEQQMAAAERGVVRQMAEKARAEAGSLPLLYTEWNNSPSCRDPYHDQPYAAAFVMKSIIDNAGLVDLYSFWTFSDIFEEMSQLSTPFHGGFGLMNIHGIPKPTYRAFELLRRTGEERLPVVKISGLETTVEMTAVRKGTELMLLLYNHQVPFGPIQPEEVMVTVKGVKEPAAVMVERIDEDHANPRRDWMEMGAPEYPDREQIGELMRKSELRPEKVEFCYDGGELKFTLRIPPHGVAGVNVESVKGMLRLCSASKCKE